MIMVNSSNNFTIGVVKDINEQLSHLLKYAFEDYISLSNSLGSFYNILKEFYNESGAFIDKDKLETILESLDQIIVDLQFHDIIRQKLEHIQKIHTVLLVELENGISDVNKTQYVVILPEVCKLNVEQLKLINEEYQTHSESIKSALQEGGGHGVPSLEAFAFDFRDTFNHTKSFIDTLENIIKSLNIMVGDVVKDRDENTIDKVMSMRMFYSMATEREVFNKLFDVVDETTDKGNDIELF
jgi:hypothetical protein